MFCMNCGKKIDDNSKFCQFCGSPIKDNVSQSMPQQQPQIPVVKKVNPILVGGIGLGCLAVVLCGVRFLSSDKQDSPAEVAVTESAPVEDNTDESVSTSADDTEVEETGTDNNIYYLSESDITSQLKGFFNFCWSNSAFNNNRDLGQDTIDLANLTNCFRSLYAITIEKSMDVGLVAIYETNPNMILTSDFADTCLAGGNSGIDNLINHCCRSKNSIKFIGSNIDGTWHFYEGTDECVYVAVSVDGHNFTIEMVQCTGDPYKWLINDIDTHLNQDLLDVKLKNEDDASLESDSVAKDSVSKEQDNEFLSAYTNYVEEVLSDEGILGYNLIYIDDDDTPECVVWTGQGDSYTTRVFVLSLKNGEIESVTTGEDGIYADLEYEPKCGDFCLEVSYNSWGYKYVFTLDESFHEVFASGYGSDSTGSCCSVREYPFSEEDFINDFSSSGTFSEIYKINGQTVSEEEYEAKVEDLNTNIKHVDNPIRLGISTEDGYSSYNDIYSTLSAAYDAL